MSMQLKRIDDPRDALDKANRKELENFAKAAGVVEVQPGMPAMLMRRILRSKGLNRITIPERTLGMLPGQQAVPDDIPGVEIDSTDDLMQQWQQQAPEPQPAPQPQQRPRYSDMPIGGMTFNEMRWACQELGIVLKATYKKEDYQRLLREHRGMLQ